MIHKFAAITIFITLVTGCKNNTDQNDLWAHIPYELFLHNSTGIKAEFVYETKNKTLNIQVLNPKKYNWCSIPEPDEGWDFSKTESIEAQFYNAGVSSLKIIFWIISKNGWSAVADTATLAPSEYRLLKCHLRETFPDGSYKVNPQKIEEIRFMLLNPVKDSRLIVSGLKPKGILPAWIPPSDHIEVPDLVVTEPKAGQRVKYQPKCAKGTNKYIVLYLPTDWTPEKRYPVIAEFPGNIYYTKDCYSTGLPESCTIGYGMTKGKVAIWVSLPFVDNNLNEISESGWGNADHTADFTLNTINEIISKFGGDRDRLVLTGFSRGAIACGYIGLRNPEIASLWKGLHACQHYDGDGWGKADLNGAKERLKRFNGSYYHTDNPKDELKQLLEDAGIPSTFANSGLGDHATAMFLDDRPSTIELRKWYQTLIK